VTQMSHYPRLAGRLGTAAPLPRSKGIQRDPKGSKGIQRDPKGFKGIQRDGFKGIQRDPKGWIQRDSKGFKGIQRDPLLPKGMLRIPLKEIFKGNISK
jgi:hypothetical protein